MENVVRVFYEGQDPVTYSTKVDQTPVSSEVKVFWDDEPVQVLKELKEVPAKKFEDENLNKPSVFPKEIEEIKIRQGELYRQKCKLANELVDIVDSSTLEQRKALVDQIMLAKDEYNQLAIMLKYWAETGQLPKSDVEEKPKLSDLQKHELLRKRTNTAANLSKKKNMVKKYQHQPAKLVKYQNEQAQLQAEINEIDELLRKG